MVWKNVLKNLDNDFADVVVIYNKVSLNRLQNSQIKFLNDKNTDIDGDWDWEDTHAKHRSTTA